LEFFIVKDDNIKLSNKLTHNDIVFVLDGKAGYIWKGTQAKDLDEFTAKKIELLIKETFKEVNFVIIPGIEILESDNPKIVQIKTEINQRLPKQSIVKIKEKPVTLFKKLKEKITEFKNYENSWNWRKKLSNLTNLWKLSIFNIVIIAICIILIFNQSIFHVIIGDFYLFIALIILLIIFSVNFIFVIFPMKFPIRVLNISGEVKVLETKKEKFSKKIPPKPKTPEMVALDMKKGLGELKKPFLKQMEITPLKAPKKKKGASQTTKEDGTEYLSEEDMNLGIPSIPEAPKKKEKITIDSPGLSTDLLEKVKKMESKNTKVVLVNCERCNDIILVPVPKNAVLKSELPVVPISYIHYNLKGKDQHCITIHIDHDFDIRRQRISDIAVSSD